MTAITVNATTYDIQRAREEMLGVFGALDAGRPNAWAQYGYKTTLTFADFLQAYERGGAGHGAVHRLLDKCWQEVPRIKQLEADKETPWEKSLKKLLTGINGWQKLRDLDRRNLVGRYAGLIYRVADNKLLSEPLGTGGKLVDLVPLYENQIKVLKWNEDELSQDYGRPEMFQFETSPPGTMEEARPRTWLKVHPSRVQMLAEGSVNGDFYNGVPLLRAGFNDLVGIEKIGGGAPESYLKNSARTLKFEYDPNATPQAIQQADGSTQSVRQVHEEQTRKLNRNQDSAIVIQGGKADTLQTTVPDPTGSFQVSANLFAASVQIPFTVLFGQQTGRLASDEDKADMVARCKSRQINELTPMLTELVQRLQAAGLIDVAEFEIEWPPLDAPGDKEKLAQAKGMAEVNKISFDSGSGEIYKPNEIRTASGYEEQPDAGTLTPQQKESIGADEAAKEAAAEAMAAAKAPGSATSKDGP